MPSFSLFVRIELRNEAGREITNEDWNQDFEAVSPYGSDTPWSRVSDAIENALMRAPALPEGDPDGG